MDHEVTEKYAAVPRTMKMESLTQFAVFTEFVPLCR